MEQSSTAPVVPKGKVAFQCSGTTFIVDAKYEIKKQIGHGAYGVVCSGVNKKTGQDIAIKKVPKAFDDLIDAKRIIREIRLLNFFDHENIVGIVDIIKPEAKTGFEDIYIIMELMETDLHRVIYSRQDLSDEHIQYFVYQMLKGILYMHSAKTMHRDLKPSNILMNKNCDLKICDFGLARGYQSDTDWKTEYVVTRWYRAPEVILDASQYTQAIDIWSAGCIFAELLGRTALFPGEDYLDQVQRIIAVVGTPTGDDLSFIGNESALKYIKSLPRRSKQQWKNLYPKANSMALDLLDKMLCFNPDKRYTVEECLAHPYLESVRNVEDEPVCEQAFDWSVDDFEPTKELLQGIVYEEACKYHKK